MNKSRHRPLESDEELRLKRLLHNIPTETRVHVKWASPEGKAFVKTVRSLQLAGVSLPTIAERLDVSHASLQSAVTYWERRVPARTQSKARVRQRRPLGRTNDESIS